MRRIYSAALAAMLAYGSLLSAAQAQFQSEQKEAAAGLQGNARESDLLKFIGYSSNDSGQTFAQFYDELGQAVFALDRKSLEQRLKNLKQQGLSADESERVMRTWPAQRDLQF